MVVENLTGSLPAEIMDNLSGLMTIFKAVGITIIAYLIFNIINVVINRRRNRKIQNVAEDVKDMKNSLKEIKKLLENKK